jgi:hypothetical protein
MSKGESPVTEVQSVVVRVTHHIDFKRWPELRALYAAEVQTDYTSLFGGEPMKQSGDALIEGWRQVLARVTTQHQLGPIDVQLDGPRAHAFCQVRALHYAQNAPGGEYWEVLGHYTFALVQAGDGWKIDAMKLATFLQTGNANLLAESRQ